MQAAIEYCGIINLLKRVPTIHASVAPSLVFPIKTLRKEAFFKTLNYLGFMPKDIPEGEKRMSYYFKSVVAKTMGINKKIFEGSK